MNKIAQHCFLLDGKTILPIDHNYQFLIPFNVINKNNNNSKYCQVNEDDLYPHSIKKLLPSRKFSTAKRSHSEEQLKHTETYLITRVTTPSTSNIDSTQIDNKPSTPPITIIIKPVLSFENHQKLYTNKSKNSSTSLKSITKRITPKQRLSTFKDLTRRILPISRTMIFNENTSSNTFHSRTLLDIYRNKKQNLI